jgi:hypothetical protein
MTGTATKTIQKASPAGNNPHAMFARPTLDAQVSPKFKARATNEEYLSSCQGTCNCDSILGDGTKIFAKAEIEEVIPKINALNLDSVKYKLINPDSGDGMTLHQANEAEKWYKHFLILVISNQEKNIVPHKKIDLFWHTHILDTRKYAADCQEAFGFMLHHFPFFGMRDDEDFIHLEAAGNETKDLYLEVFGEPLENLTKVFVN